MRKLLCLLSVIISLNAFAQPQGPNTDSFRIPVDGTGGSYWALRTLPDDYNSTTTNYPIIFFFHGQGEQGNSLAQIYNATSAGGPAYFIAHGQWPTSFVNPKDGKSYKFIVISPHCPFNAINNSVSTNPNQVQFMIQYMVTNFRVDPTRIYLTGLSAGGPATIEYPNAIDNNCSTITSTYKPAAVVPMSADFNAGCMQTIGVGLATKKIGVWGFGDPVNDTHGANTSGVLYYVNQTVPGWGTFTTYTGGHCCWNTFYIPTFTQMINGFTQNIEQWMLNYTTAPPSTVPVVNIPIPTISITLPYIQGYVNAVGTAIPGTGRTISNYTWSYVSGPNSYILNPSGASTIISGLLTKGTYVYKLTATDDIGQTGSANITVNVNAPPYLIRNGEYLNYAINTGTKRAFALGSPIGIGTNTPHLGYAMPIVFNAANSNPNIVEGAFGLHNGVLISDTGRVYVYSSDNGDAQMGNGTQTGDTDNKFVEITTDSSGNPFNSVVFVEAASSVFTPSPKTGSIFYAIKSNGSAWYWGNAQGGYAGDSSYGKVTTRPKMIKFPTATYMTKIIAQDVVVGLDSTGSVWTWGGDVTSSNGHGTLLGDNTRTTTDFMYPKKITLPSRAVDIAGAGKYTIIQLANGQVYGFGFYTGYLGIGTQQGSGSNFNNPGKPFRVDTAWNLPKAIARISSANLTIHLLLVDGSLYGMGGNEAGQVGNGQEIDWNNYTTNPAPYGGTTPSPYQWNQDPSTAQLLVFKPTLITPGKHYMDMSNGKAAVWYKYQVDSSGMIYSQGRGKTGMLANGTFECDPVQGGLGSLFPNMIDRPDVTPLTRLFSNDTTFYQTCPTCIATPGVSPCSNCGVVPNTGPHAVTPSQQIPVQGSAVLNAASSTDDKKIIKWKWSQLSGPNQALMGIVSQPTDTIQGFVAGTYVFKIVVTDASWATDSTTTVLTVVNSAPIVNAGSDQTVSLPITSVTLSGTVTPNGTPISSTTWSQDSGPNTATITSPSSTTTTVTNLIQGKYIFRLTARDANGLTSFATMTLNAGSCNCLLLNLPAQLLNQ